MMSRLNLDKAYVAPTSGRFARIISPRRESKAAPCNPRLRGYMAPFTGRLATTCGHACIPECFGGGVKISPVQPVFELLSCLSRAVANRTTSLLFGLALNNAF